MRLENQWSLFGVDLRRAIRWLMLAGEQLLWGPEAGIHTRFCEPARLFTVDGSQRLILETGEHPHRNFSGAPVAAVELPESLCLERTLALPESAEIEVEAAVSFDVRANSPFPADDTVFGWRILTRSNGKLQIAVVIVSLAAVNAWLRKRINELDLAEPLYEVWAAVSAEQYVVLSGFGEGERRHRYLQSLRGLFLMLAGTLLAWLVLLALPGFVASMRVDALSQELSRITTQARHATDMRRKVGAERDILDQLQRLSGQSISHDYWLNRLATLAPDTVYFSRLSFDGRRVEASGFADDAASFLNDLAKSDEFSSLKAPSAFTRDRVSGKERFTITMNVPGEEAQ